MTLRFIEDPGHAWLEVSRSAVEDAGVLSLISEYSYQSKTGETLYLEEDCDAPEYLKKAGGSKIRSVYMEKCFVRDLPSFDLIGPMVGFDWPEVKP